jgi:hypothetical protein
MLIQREGVYYGQCSELCGVHHGFMPIVVEAVSLEKYLTWLSEQLDNSPSNLQDSFNNFISSPNEDEKKSLLDIPIQIKLETTPRNIGKLAGNVVIGGSVGYAAWYGMRLGLYAAEHTGGTVFTRTTLIASGAIAGGIFGLMGRAIGRAQGPRGPFVNLNISINDSKTVDAITQTAENTDTSINSMFEPFTLIDPFSTIPIIAILSGSLILIFLSIQCLNFIVIRVLFLRYSSYIENLFLNFPFLNNLLKKFVEIFNKLSFIYYVIFTLLAYIYLIGACYYLYELLILISQYK